jgi:hypothetical protein
MDGMRVYVYPADEFGCGKYRLIWPSEHLIKLGYDVRVRVGGDRDDFDAEITQDGRVVRVGYPRDADVIVFQRITHRFLAQAVPLIRAAGVAVVMDIDDDLSHVPPSNPAYAAFHPRKSPDSRTADHSWRETFTAAEASTLVACSTPALARIYGRRGNGRVLLNFVPEWYLDVPHEDSDLVGWGAGLHSHADDAPILGTSVARLMDRGREYCQIGGADRLRGLLRLPRDPILLGPVDLDRYPWELATLGVGVAPLADSVFNQSKSWLKPLEMAAVGVPCVMSPRAEYRAIRQLGVGMLASRPRDWYATLDRLTKSPATRLELSAAGRLAAAELTIEQNAWRWWELWSEALELQRG